MAQPKKSKAERQAELGRQRRGETPPPVSTEIPEEGEPSIDDLLGDETAAPGKTPRVKAPSVPRTAKGEMVSFLNKAGQRITGPGVKYYVTRFNGKLHYKEASQVTFLPDDWKEGDPLPGDVNNHDVEEQTEEDLLG